MTSYRPPAFALALFLAAVSAGAADEPVVAGQNDVAVPKRTKMVTPVYPADAQARGQRGIVILEIVVGPDGKVSGVQIIRSVPPFDEPATEAVRQWEYEVTKVQGKPVSVKFTVPILFAMKLPDVTERQEGIPELRAGAIPPMPSDLRERGKATAEVTLGTDGAVEELRVLDGAPALAESLTRALRTWRFSVDSEEATLTFRVGAHFIPGDKPKVEFTLDGLRRSESLGPRAAASTAPATAPTAPPPVATTDATTAPSAPTPAAPQAPSTPPTPAPTPAPTPTPGAPAAPPSIPPAPSPSVPAAKPTPSAPAPAAPAAPATETLSATDTPAARKAAPPPTEVLNVPPPAEPPENGLSAVRDVTLAPGVPDLTRGRRPVPPPIARMTDTTGSVEVAFSVDAAGITSVKGSTGPDALKKAAELAVGSWNFRRTRADRIFLLAEFKYAAETATAAVRPDTR
jgi:TonB family protein